jgi:hypothetical protein
VGGGYEQVIVRAGARWMLVFWGATQQRRHWQQRRQQAGVPSMRA